MNFPAKPLRLAFVVSLLTLPSVFGALPIACAAEAATPAEIRLSQLFSDGMVLQRDTPANIWGLAPPGERISITVNNKTAQTIADAKGDWQAQLPAQNAGGPYELTVAGKNTITIKDVYFGDVWLLSGQSNMEWTSKSLLRPEIFAVENPAAKDALLRFFTVKKNPQLHPTREVSGQWLVCTPESMASFSGAGYFFGRKLRQNLTIPIGLIGSYWGGTEVQPWTTFEAVEKLYPDLKATWEKNFADYPAQKLEYENVRIPRWQEAVAKAKAEGTKLPGKPGLPAGAPENQNRPGALYNGMIAPLVPLSLKGIAWYQGESNGDNLKEALEYNQTFPALIKDWRAQWQQEVPFLFVQLAAHRKLQEKPAESTQAWPYVREAQTAALGLPKTGMAIVLDNDDPDTIHPKDKITVGTRLADVALGVVYGQKVPYTGPLFESWRVDGNTAKIRFKHTDGGLKTRGEVLQGFAIAGEDGNFVWADAKIEGDSVLLSSPAVPQPKAVRYGWADNPIGNLINGAGLPASPFRTDIDNQPTLPR